MSLCIDSRSLGRIVVKRLGSETYVGGVFRMDRQRLRLIPARRPCFAETKMGVGIDVLRDQEGYRRFIPADSSYVTGAHAVGLEACGFTARDRLTAIIVKAAFDMIRPSHLWRRRNFNREVDLLVRLPNRAADDDQAVLSSAIMTAVDCPTVGALMAMGKRMAKEAGYGKPNNETAVKHAFYEIARRFPLREPTQETIDRTFREAFFDSRKIAAEVAKEVQQEIEARLSLAVRQHLDHGPVQLRRWLSVSHGNALKTICGMANRPLGRLDRNVVKAALLNFLWRERRRFAAPLNRFAQIFADRLDEPLTAAEATQFFALFGGSPQFADMPPVMWSACRSFARPAVARLWVNPADEMTLGILYRQLQLYSELSTERRDADLRGKRPLNEDAEIARKLNERDVQFKNGEAAFLATIPYIESDASEREEALDRICELRQIRCPQCRGSLCCDFDNERSLIGANVEFMLRCGNDDHSARLTIPIREWQNALAKIRELNRK